MSFEFGEFKIGDRVRYVSREDMASKNGKVGTIAEIATVKIVDSIRYGVIFDEKIYFGHDLSGLCPNGYGWWCRSDNLELETELEAMMESWGVFGEEGGSCEQEI